MAVSDPTGTIARPLPAIARVDSPRRAAALDAADRRGGARGASWWASPRLAVGRAGGAGAGGRGVRGSPARARFGLPVELWDERLTTVEAVARGRESGLAGRPRQPRGLRAAEAYLAASRVSGCGPRTTAATGAARRRAAAAARTLAWLVVVVVMVAAAGLALAPWRRSAASTTPAAADHDGAARAALTFPRGSAPRGDRRAPRREDRDLAARATWRPRRPARAARALREDPPPDLARGLPLPGDVRDRRRAPRRRSSSTSSSRPTTDNTADVDYRYARSKNLTKYDVLIIASMIEREVRGARASGRWWRASSTTACNAGCGSTSTRRCSTRWASGRPTSPRPTSPSTRPTTRAAIAGLPPGPDLQPGPREHRAPPRARRRRTSSTTWPATTAAARHYFAPHAGPVRGRRGRARQARTAAGSDADRRRHPGRRDHRVAGGALAVAGDAQRGVRGARPQLGLRWPSRCTPTACGEAVRGLAAAGCARPERDDPPQAGGPRALLVPSRAAVRAIGAANTLVPDGEGGFRGDNTDAEGFLRAARRAGAARPGGARRAGDRRRGRGPGRRLRPARARRPRARGQPHARSGRPSWATRVPFVRDALDVVAGPVRRWWSTPPASACTATLCRAELPLAGLGPDQVVADLVYRPGGTPWLAAAAARGRAARWTGWGCCCTRARRRSSSGPAGAAGRGDARGPRPDRLAGRGPGPVASPVNHRPGEGLLVGCRAPVLRPYAV